jgi:hypothetical protein
VRSSANGSPAWAPALIAPGAPLMILLSARRLLVCPGTNRQRPVLAGIRSRREMRNAAACGILCHRLAESNTCCRGLLICWRITASPHGGAAMVGSTRQLTCGTQPAHAVFAAYLRGRQSDLSVPVRGCSPVSVRAARRPGISVRATRTRRGCLSVQSMPEGLNCSRPARPCPWIRAPAPSAICP